jgi:cytochrome b561
MRRYTLPAITLHWLMALMIIGAFGMGLVMTEIPGITPTKLKYYSWHKWAGVTILLLALVRLGWRIGHAPPPYPDTMPLWQQRAANHLHRLLYVLILAVPLSGYFYTLSSGFPVVWFGVIELPVLMGPDPELKPLLKSLHYWLNMTLAACVLAHIGAALKHQFIDRDGVLRRMWP